LLRNLCAPQSSLAAQASTENWTLIAAVNRCATQKQEQDRVVQQTSVRRRGCSSWHVKLNSTLLQTALRADFALPLAENEV
jgi:hypothetical protein